MFTCKSLSPLSARVAWLQQVAGYARMRASNPHISGRRRYFNDDPEAQYSEDKDEEILHQLEDFSTQMIDKEQATMEHIRIQSESERRRMIHAIIKRKYFKPAQEANLLSWDAKEQIRYLVQEFPEEWTAERISHSFPISKEGVYKLLKSKFKPGSIDQVLKHDKKVQKNWLALKSGKPHEMAGPIKTRYEALVEQGKLHTLQNAAGAKALPQSSWQHTLLQSYFPPKKQPGLFESIVKDYCEKKQAQEELQSRRVSYKQLLADIQKENVQLLGGVTKSVDKEQGGNVKMIADGSKSEATEKTKWNINMPTTDEARQDFRKAFQYEDVNLKTNYDGQNIIDMLSTDRKSGTLLDNPVSQVEEKVRGRSLRRRRTNSESDNVNIDDLQMSGTGMVSSRSDGAMQESRSSDLFIDSDGDTDDSQDFQRHKTSYNNLENPESTEALKSIKYETNEHGEQSAYIYGEGGYQYPYGKRQNIPSNIKVPKEQRNKNTVFKQGNNYYDDDGEFLFRTP